MSAEQAAVYANRRRIRASMASRSCANVGELVERTFAHCYETGAMRRTHLRGHPNHSEATADSRGRLHLSLVMRSLFGIGKPRRLQDGLAAAIVSVSDSILGLLRRMGNPLGVSETFAVDSRRARTQNRPLRRGVTFIRQSRPFQRAARRSDLRRSPRLKASHGASPRTRPAAVPLLSTARTASGTAVRRFPSSSRPYSSRYDSNFHKGSQYRG